MEQLREQMRQVMDAQPNLTAFGFENKTSPRYERNREEMLSSRGLEEFNSAMTWLGQQRKLKVVKTIASSYYLKHVAERAMKTYISNGIFIAAAYAMGVVIKPDWPNAYLGLGRESYNNR